MGDPTNNMQDAFRAASAEARRTFLRLAGFVLGIYWLPLTLACLLIPARHPAAAGTEAVWVLPLLLCLLLMLWCVAAGAVEEGEKELARIPQATERRRCQASLRRSITVLACLCMALVLTISLCAFFASAKGSVGVWWHWLAARLGGH